VVSEDANGDALRRRAFVAAGAAIVATTTIFACSLRDTSYLQAGGGPTLPNEGGGADNVVPVVDGETPTKTATVVAADQFAPSLLTQDDENLYWANSDGNLMAIRKDGSESAPRTVFAAGPGVIALATTPGATALFYTKGSQVFTVTKSGGAATPIATTDPPARALAVDPSFVFAMAEDEQSDVEPTLVRFQHDGGVPTVLRVASDSLYMYAIALQGNDVFWDEGEGTFFSLPKTAAADAGPTTYEGPNASGLVESALYANAFAVDETAFFYSDSTNVRTHQRAPTSTPNTAIAYSADTTSVRAVAIDDRWVYGVETGANGTLRRNTKDAKGEPELMLAGLATPNSIAVDANAVYLAVEGPPGAIVKCAK
jgi:hypothetical protein